MLLSLTNCLNIIEDIEGKIHTPIVTPNLIFLNNQILGWKMMQETSKIMICETEISVYATTKSMSGHAGQMST